MPYVYRSTTILLTQPCPKEAGATQQATHTPSAGTRHRNCFCLGAHLAPVQIIGFLFEKRPACLCLEKVETTSGMVMDRRFIHAHNDGFWERRDHDGDVGSAAKHYLEKLNLIVALFGHRRNAGRNDDFMNDVRGHMMSRLQRYVSIFCVYLSIYRLRRDEISTRKPWTTYDEMPIEPKMAGRIEE